MAFSVSERLQIVYSDNPNKYNIEKEAEEDQLSTIEFVKLFRNSCCILLHSMHVAVVSQNWDVRAAMAFSVSTKLQMVYIDNFSKYKIEKETNYE